MSSTPPNNFMMQRLPWIIAAVAVLALIATLLWSRNDRAGGSDTAAMQELRERLQVLEEGPGQGNARRSSPLGGSPLPGSMSGVPGGLPDEMEQRAKMTPEQLEAERKRELQTLEAEFNRDAADPVKGAQVEHALEQTVTGETMRGTGLKPDDVAIDCKANSCRIVADFGKTGDAQDWALFYLTAAAPNLSRARMALVPNADGSSEIRIYAARSK